MELSKRLQAVANLVSYGVSVADVGTDHGYLPIYLVQSGKCTRGIAMDVNKGPLLRAKNHIEIKGMSSKIDTRLSDGVQQLSAGEVECVVIAGMGGALTVRILEQGQHIFRDLKEFVLQPQSEIWKVREYLCTHGYSIVDEDMVLEDGKFYPMMKVVRGQASEYKKIDFTYGKLLLEKRHPVLQEFLTKELKKQHMVISRLDEQKGTNIDERRIVIREKIGEIEDALQRYHESN